MIETPEEFVCRIRDRYEDSFTMDWDDAEKEVLTRDAVIRADEQQKAAERWEIYERDNLHRFKGEDRIFRGKAAIMGEQ